MEELKQLIKDTLEELEYMIKRGENKSKITKQKKRLNDLLEKYLEDI